MKRSLAMAAVSVVLSGALVGCGSGDGGTSSTESYCDEMKSAKESLAGLDGTSSGDLEKAFTTVHDLADSAPDAVADDWQVLDDAVSGIEQALDKAGLKLSDLDKMSSGEMPADLDPAKLQQLAQDMQQLGTDQVQQAADNIEKHAKDECGVDLNAS
ncbi:MAG TPA: hypothetical protein PLP61_07310 [Nocardioides sp.]|uniref:hypothetical protein n=1 Tax=Nocardioides sp. TaxID=35761 RepID=UPI002D1B0B70|nr:hypothetical protein [Nocardioides sp.]HQR26829.1 hypothetical protein [Nocardioides sp.]